MEVEDNSQKAQILLRNAMKNDESGNHQSAFQAYLLSMHYFILAEKYLGETYNDELPNFIFSRIHALRKLLPNVDYKALFPEILTDCLFELVEQFGFGWSDEGLSVRPDDEEIAKVSDDPMKPKTCSMLRK